MAALDLNSIKPNPAKALMLAKREINQFLRSCLDPRIVAIMAE